MLCQIHTLMHNLDKSVLTLATIRNLAMHS